MRSNRLNSRLTIVGFFVVVLVPWLAGLAGVRPTTSDNRPLRSFPVASSESVMESSFFRELSLFLDDHTPLRQEAAAALNVLVLATTGQSPVTDAFVGTDGTYFLSQDLLEGCRVPYDPAEVAAAFDELNAASEGPDFRLLIAPDKASVDTDVYSWRMGLARGCADSLRQSWIAEATTSDAVIPLWSVLREQTSESDSSLYYKYDSHWTFEGAAVYAEVLVDHFAPGTWSGASVEVADEFQLTSDIARRFGQLRYERRDSLTSTRPGVTTTLAEDNIGGTRTIRTYRSSGGPLVPGRTILIHDSMNNFAEQMLAPYFEEVVMVHWDDIELAPAVEQFAGADRVVFESVERLIHRRAIAVFLDDAKLSSLLSAF